MTKIKYENLTICSLCGSKSIYAIDKLYQFYSCQNCGYIFDNPRPSSEAIFKYYAKSDNFDYWQSLKKGREVLWKRRYQIINKYIKSGKLLDVGAGIGEFLNEAKSDFIVTGTEVSPKAIAMAGQKFGIKLLKGEVEEIKLPYHNYDVITLFHVLEHVPYPLKTISQCASLLKKDGLLFIAVPNEIQNIKQPLKKLLRKLKIGHYKNYSAIGLPKIEIKGTFGEIHLSHFTPKVLAGFLSKNGFTVINNSLDPYYTGNGFSDRLRFFFFEFIHKLTGYNLYDTIFIVAKKK